MRRAMVQRGWIRAAALLLPMVAAMATAVPGRAESMFGLRAGYYALTSGSEFEDLLQGTAKTSDLNAGTLGISGAHYFTERLGVELTADAYIPDIDLDVNPDPNVVFPVNVDVDIYPIALSARYRLSPGGFSPYGIAGVSLNPYKFQIRSDLFPEVGVDQSGVEFGYQLGVGAEIPFLLRWMGTVELLYRGMDIGVEFQSPTGSLLEFSPSFNGFQFVASVNYLF